MRTTSDSKTTTGSIPRRPDQHGPAASPGDLIRNGWTDESGETPAQLADRLGWSLAKTKRLLSGELVVDREVALCLKQTLGCSIGFWLRVERHWDKYGRQAKG